MNRLATGYLNINSLLNRFDTLRLRHRHRVRHSLDMSMIFGKKLDETFPEGRFLVNGFTQRNWMDKSPKVHGLALYFEEDVTSRQNSFRNNHVNHSLKHSFTEIFL